MDAVNARIGYLRTLRGQPFVRINKGMFARMVPGYAVVEEVDGATQLLIRISDGDGWRPGVGSDDVATLALISGLRSLQDDPGRPALVYRRPG